MTLLPKTDLISTENGLTLPDSFFKYNYFFSDCMTSFQDCLYLGGFDPKNVELMKKKAMLKNQTDRWKVNFVLF